MNCSMHDIVNGTIYTKKGLKFGIISNVSEYRT